MFDAHRHFSPLHPADKDALYATSSFDEWEIAHRQSQHAACSLGILPQNLPSEPALLYEHLTRSVDLQIGEVGLDRRYGSLDEQLRFLDEVLEIGYVLNRSVTLHCVRADGHLINLLRTRKSRLPVTLWHGCTASTEIRREAARLGLIISYGPKLYQSKIAREPASLIATPWVLESDWEGPEEEYLLSLEQHITRFATLTGLSEASVVGNNDEKRAILTNQSTPRR